MTDDSTLYHVWWDTSVLAAIVYRGPSVFDAKEAYRWAVSDGTFPVYAYATQNGEQSTYLTKFVHTYLGVPE
jgi:hypothetical protein